MHVPPSIPPSLPTLCAPTLLPPSISRKTSVKYFETLVFTRLRLHLNRTQHHFHRLINAPPD